MLKTKDEYVRGEDIGVTGLSFDFGDDLVVVVTEPKTEKDGDDK